MDRLVSLIISTYVAIALYANLFFIERLEVLEGADKLFWNHLAIFLILLVAAFFVISRFVSLTYSRNRFRYLHTPILAIVFIGLIISILYHIIPLEPVFNLPTIVDQAFASDTAFTIWLLIPLIVLFI